MQAKNSKLIKKILTGYAVAFFVINLADSLTMIADGMIISRALGAKSLAAIGLADPSYKIMSLFSWVIATGLQSLCAQAMGSGDREKANRLFSAGMIVTAAVSVLLTVLCFTFTGTLCALFGAGDDPVIYQDLHAYLRGWFVGIPGYVIFHVLSPLVTLDGNKKNVTAATFIQSFVNIVGDLLSVFVMKSGVYGVGLATGMSYNLSAVVLMLNFVRKRSVFRPFSEPPDFRELPKVLHIGLPKITEHLSRIAGPLFINRVILFVGGSIAMSAISVKSSIFGFCVIIGNGVAESVGLLSQILYNEKDAEGLKSTVKTGLKLLATLDIAFSAALFLLAGKVVEMYLPAGTQEWALGVMAVRCLALSIVLNGCNQTVIKYLQSARRMAAVHLMMAFHRMIALAVFTAALGFSFGTLGLFAAIPVSEAAVLLGYLAVTLLRGRGQGFWNAVLLIPDGFGYNSENSCAFSIATVEEAVSVSERVEAFCGQHQVNHRTAYFSGRCMEELATNVVEHGFTKDDKKHYCDIRVMLEPDEVVLRIRDDCPYFDIRERYDSLTEDDLSSSIGIRLVFAHAKEVNYINIFNTNTLIIRM